MQDFLMERSLRTTGVVSLTTKILGSSVKRQLLSPGKLDLTAVLQRVSHLNVQSLRNCSTYSLQEEGLIHDLCTNVVELYHSYRDRKLFPSLTEDDIADIQGKVMDGTYHFSELEILSFPHDKYLTDYVRDPDYPDVHWRYNESEKLVYVVKPTSPKDCLLLLAIAETLSVFLNGYAPERRMDAFFLLKDLEPVDLLYRIDLTPSYSPLTKEALLGSLKKKLDFESQDKTPVYLLYNREEDEKARRQFFLMLEEICNLPIIKGDNFGGEIPPEWGLPPTGGKLADTFLDLILTDRFDKDFENVFPRFFRNDREAFIPLQRFDGRIHPSVDRRQLEQFIQRIGLRGTIEPISRAKGHFPFGWGLYDDLDPHCLVIMPDGTLEVVHPDDLF